MVESITETRISIVTETVISTSTVQVATTETLSQQPTALVDSCRMELLMATIIPITVLLVIGMLAIIILLAYLLVRERTKGQAKRYIIFESHFYINLFFRLQRINRPTIKRLTNDDLYSGLQRINTPTIKRLTNDDLYSESSMKYVACLYYISLPLFIQTTTARRNDIQCNIPQCQY